MTGTSNALAVRDDTALEAHTGALAISADQVQWTTMQEAALNQLGLKNAPNGDRLVFLHVAQRTGLDPFAKQIHMIERAGKWSIQTGIDGFRVNRARAEKKAGVLGILGQAVYIDAEGNEYKRWFKPGPPVGCEITYTVRDLDGTETPYTSYLRFTEYAQYKADGKLTQKWSASPAHMLEKCTEADVYRKAFPQDFSGLNLDDAQAGDGSDGPPAEPVTRRRRITADAIRARTVTATVVTPDVPPAQAAPQTADPVPPEGAGGDLPPLPGDDGPPGGQYGDDKHKKLVGIVQQHFKRLGYGDDERDQRLADAAQVASVSGIASLNDLTHEELSAVADTMSRCRNRDALKALLVEKDDPRGETGE